MADGSKSTNKLQQLFKFMCNRCNISQYLGRVLN